MKYCTPFILILGALLAFPNLLAAQLIPAPAQSEPIVLLGATAHLGNGKAIENAAVAFEDGKLTYVGPADGWNNNDQYAVLQLSGKHIYPGFIAANTQLGLIEIGAVRATRDANETGEFNPNVRSIIAYNTDSDVTPTVRSNGVLLAQATPEGGRISGTSSVVQLDAWNWEDAAYATDEGVHVQWPRRFRYRWRAGRMEENKEYKDQVAELEAFLKSAKAYQESAGKSGYNAKLAAMEGLFTDAKQLYVHADDARAIQESVSLALSVSLKPVIVGGTESYLITEFLKQYDIAVILHQTQSLPARTHRPVDEPFQTPRLLEAAGVRYCLSMDGTWELRNLPFQAGQAVGYGLEYEKAVQSITGNAAAILGIGDRTGTLEKGKDANLFVSAGDALDMRTCKVEQAYIQGREINLDNKQKALYRKYQEKYSRD